MKTLTLLLIALAVMWLIGGDDRNESFYNVVPTELIDPEYVSSSCDRWAHTVEWPQGHRMTFQRVGDTYGVDLNCNNVTSDELVEWIHNSCPQVLFDYVLRYDPSIDIQNPNHAPRVLKGLLRNLPENHKFLPIVRKCFPRHVRV